MKLSVILPVYNGMPYIAEAISSLINQSYQDFIVYAIDNGSTDGSKEYLTKLKNEKIKYIGLKEKNLVKALNKGLEISTTALIARMDADDISHLKRFQKQVDYLEQNTQVDCVGTLGKYISSNGKKQFDINLPLQHDDIIRTMLNTRNAILHPSIMFRRQIITNYGGYNEQYPDCEDYEFFLRIGDKVRFANLPERLHYMRIREGSIITENIRKSLTLYYFVSHKYSSNYFDNYKIDKPKKDFHLNVFQKLDITSLSIYRKGLNYFLNKNTFVGLLYFLIASIVNPHRFINAIRRKLNYISNI